MVQHSGKYLAASKKLGIHLSYNPAIAILGIYPNEMKTYVHTKTCTQVVTAALCVIAKGENVPNVVQW